MAAQGTQAMLAARSAACLHKMSPQRAAFTFLHIKMYRGLQLRCCSARHSNAILMLLLMLKMWLSLHQMEQVCCCEMQMVPV